MIENSYSEYYKGLEKLISTALDKVKFKISREDYNDIEDYIDHGEYGVAWELLWHLVNQKKLSYSDELILSGKKMGFYVDTRGLSS